MKKYLSLLAIALLLASGSTAWAETEIDGSIKVDVGVNAKARPLTPEERAKIDEARKKMEVRKAELRPIMNDDRAGMKAEFRGDIEARNEQVGDMQTKARGMVAGHIIRRAENLAQISGRIKTRLEKLKTEDKIETAAALALIVKADAQIAIAKTHGLEMKAGVEANASIETLKQHAEEARTALKLAHEYLRQAVEDIKGRLPKDMKAEVKVNTGVRTSTSSNQ